MSHDQKAVSRRIRRAIKKANVSVPDIADACGISAPAVYQWFSRGTISKTHLPTVARMTGTTVYYLLTGQDSADIASHLSDDAITVAKQYDAIPEDKRAEVRTALWLVFAGALRR